MTATVVYQEGALEGVEVFSDFDETIQAMISAFERNLAFLALEKSDGSKVAFAMAKITRIEEVEVT